MPKTIDYFKLYETTKQKMRKLLTDYVKASDHSGGKRDYLDEFAELKEYMVDLGVSKLGMIDTEVLAEIRQIRSDVFRNKEQPSGK